jgi:hypothetical protein
MNPLTGAVSRLVFQVLPNEKVIISCHSSNLSFPDHAESFVALNGPGFSEDVSP